jgi:hypothetical protein
MRRRRRTKGKPGYVESKRDRERREANMSAEETQKGGTEKARVQRDKRKKKKKK